MARRPRLQTSDSLELLLDTITNAFGGILFLALLIVILSQKTTLQSTTTPDLDPTVSSSRRLTLQELDAELAALERQASAREAIADNLGDEELADTIRRLEAARRQKHEVLQDIAGLRLSIGKGQAEIESLEDKEAELRSEQQRILEELDEVRSNIERERASRKISSPFPEERAATKSHVAATIRYGRWYLNRYASGEANLDDFAVLDSEGEFLTLAPKPYKGTPLLDGNDLSHSLQQFLATKDPKREYIDMSIWDDSYPEFQLLRDYLVEHGFEYRLVIVKEGDEVVEGYVPNPQVQ